MPDGKLIATIIALLSIFTATFVSYIKDIEKDTNNNTVNTKSNNPSNTNCQNKANTNFKTETTKNISTSKLDYYIDFLIDKQIYNVNIFLKRKPFTIPMELEINIRTNKDNPQIYDTLLRELLNLMLLYIGLPYARCRV